LPALRFPNGRCGGGCLCAQVAYFQKYLKTLVKAMPEADQPKWLRLLETGPTNENWYKFDESLRKVEPGTLGALKKNAPRRAPLPAQKEGINKDPLDDALGEAVH